MNWSTVLSSFAWLADPVNITLILTLVLIGLVIVKAQRREDFDFAEFLRDGCGKLSAFRLISCGAYAVSAWVLMRYVGNYAVPEWMWQDFLLAFSGSSAIEKVAEAWAAKKAGQ